MSTTSFSPEATLGPLGFTEVESLLYCELLRQGPMTGYRLAMAVSKAPANTYQALKTLAQKGGVVFSETSDDAKSYCAVPAAQLLASLSHQFDEYIRAATVSLENISSPGPNERVFQLQTASQAIERARAMLANSKEIVLFDSFPPLLDLLAKDVANARARGVVVAGIAYEEAHKSETVPFNAAAAGVLWDLWPGLSINIVVDGTQVLMAHLTRDQSRLLHGIWSDSAFLSSNYHSALAAEIQLVANRYGGSDKLRHISLFNAKPSGLRELLSRML